MNNTNAVVSDNASADASASEMSLGSLADTITKLFNTTLEQLIAMRDSAYADAMAELDGASKPLVKEHALLEEGIKAIEDILPAKERLAQREIDELVVAARPKAEVQAKVAELETLKRKPTLMRGQQRIITGKLESIQAEKQAATREVFEQWLTEVRPVVRAAERGLLVVLLGGIEKSLYAFQERVGMTKLDNRTRPLVNQGTITSLTSDGRSDEYAAGRHWYR